MTPNHFRAATHPNTATGAIHVPQACFGIAHGPLGPIEYIKTRVAQCVAVALSVTTTKQEFPFVILAHLDDGKAGIEQAEMLLEEMEELIREEVPLSRHAYVLNGDSNPDLYEPVIESLESASYQCSVKIMDSQVPTLIMSLRTGHPPDAIPATGFLSYEPKKEVQGAFDNFVFSNRVRHPLDHTVLIDTMAIAFNLRVEIPPYYEPNTAKAQPQQAFDPRF